MSRGHSSTADDTENLTEGHTVSTKPTQRFLSCQSAFIKSFLG